MSAELSPIATLVRQHDPDRFFTALFAPPAWREALFTLYSFNHELARAREVASLPVLALIRLQWWREVAEGARRRHEVAWPLGAAIDAGLLDPADLLTMIEGREQEADESIASLDAWKIYLEASAGGLAVAAGRLLGASGGALERLRALGAAYGVAGQLRSVAGLAGQGRCQLPEDVLGGHGQTIHTVMAAPNAAALQPILADLAEVGKTYLDQGRGALPRAAIAAALPAVLARRDLRRVDRPGIPRGLGDRLAVLTAAALSRV